MVAILCPTRGGKESHPNQDFAVELARQRGAALLFLYVSDIQFLKRAGPPIVVDIQGEMAEVGDFLLSMAQERAEMAGVSASVIVRSGLFRDVLREVIAENEIDTVVLGSASGESGFVSLEHLQQMSEELSRELGVEFILLQDGRQVFSAGA